MNWKEKFLKLATQLRDRRKVATAEKVFTLPMGISPALDQEAKKFIDAQYKMESFVRQKGEEIFILGSLAQKLIDLDPSIQTVSGEPALARAASLRKLAAEIRVNEIPSIEVNESGALVFSEADADDFWSPKSIQIALENLYEAGQLAMPPAKQWDMNFRLKYLRPWLTKELRVLLSSEGSAALEQIGTIPGRGPSKAEMDVTYALEKSLREVGEMDSKKMYEQIGGPFLEETLDPEIEDIDVARASLKSDVIADIERYFKVWEYVRITPSSQGTAQNWWIRGKILSDLPESPMAHYIKGEATQVGIGRKRISPPKAAPIPASAQSGILGNVQKIVGLAIPDTAKEKLLIRALEKADLTELDPVEQGELYQLLHEKIPEEQLNTLIFGD